MNAQIRVETAHPPVVSDEESITTIERHRADALSELHDRYSSILKALAMRIVRYEAEAEDLLMEIYMEIWCPAPCYSPVKGRSIHWLVPVTRRRAIDRLKSGEPYLRREERNEAESQPGVWAKNAVDTDFEIQDLRGVLARVLASLPPAQQQAIRLAYHSGMSQREIAAFTGATLGSIKTARARPPQARECNQKLTA